MTIDVEKRSGVTVLHIKGEIASHDGDAIAEEATTVLEQGTGGIGIVIDLAEVPFINSAGLGSLVNVVAQANTHEQRVILASPSPHIEGVLQATKLDQFFETCPTLDDAVNRLR